MKSNRVNCGVELCPLKELPLSDDEFKGTCDLDDGDCLFPLNPENWLECKRLREYLMQDVIKELEHKSITASREGAYVVMAIYDKAIALIRDGVNV